MKIFSSKNPLLFSAPQLLYLVPDYGNCISASIPLGLEKLINSGFEPTGKKVLILGSGAGLSIGAQLLDFS